MQGQAGLQAAPEQLHRQLHVAGTQGVVSSHRVLWAGGISAPRSHPLTGTETHWVTQCHRQGLDYPTCDINTSVWPHARTQPSLSQLWFGSSWCQQGDRTGPQTSVGEGEGFVPCLRLILGEMQAAQLLHPHVGVSQLCHVVTQGQDAVGTTRKGHIKPGRICCAGARNSRQWPG